MICFEFELNDQKLIKQINLTNFNPINDFKKDQRRAEVAWERKGLIFNYEREITFDGPHNFSTPPPGE